MATGRLPDPNTAPLTAKGDLYTYSTAPARLAVGSDGETLVADSSTSTGLRWQSAFNGNSIINSGMEIWQRGTSFTAASVYTADRWFKDNQTFSTISRQTSGLTGFNFSLRTQRNSGQTGTADIGVVYNLETADSLRFAGQTITVSFWARAGANYSPTSSLLKVYVASGTGTDQLRSFAAAYTGEAAVVNTSQAITTSWVRYSFTGTVASSATQLCVYLAMAGTGTAGANDWFEITGVQMEVGSVATTWKRAGGTLAGELAACQRYYWREGGDDAYQRLSFGSANSTTDLNFYTLNPVYMRTDTPSVEYSTLAVFDGTTITAITNLTRNADGRKGVLLAATVASGLTQFRPYQLITNNSTSGYLALNAEL